MDTLTIVAGLIDNSFEIWQIHHNSSTSEHSGWQPTRVARIECAQRQLLYCMELSVDVRSGSGDAIAGPALELTVHVASGAPDAAACACRSLALTP